MYTALFYICHLDPNEISERTSTMKTDWPEKRVKSSVKQICREIWNAFGFLCLLPDDILEYSIRTRSLDGRRATKKEKGREEFQLWGKRVPSGCNRLKERRLRQLLTEDGGRLERD